MSEPSNGVMRVARSVANGEGDWAEVPSAVRDAIVLAVTQFSTAPLRSLDSSRIQSHHLNRATNRGSPAKLNPAVLAQSGASGLHLSASRSPSVLTENNVQSSIQTFEDAAWVRDEAVRSYAEFHNNIESLHAAMRTQLHPVWKTAMQLRPGLLADVRDHFKLSRTDEIPDGIPINPSTAQHIAQQSMILDEVEDTLQMLRNTSVRFAAHFLSDEEKISMGANPAYLRAPDIDREVVESRAQSVSASVATPAAAAEGPTPSPSAQNFSQVLYTSHGHAPTRKGEDGLVESRPRTKGNRHRHDTHASEGDDVSSGSRHHHRHPHHRHSRRHSSKGEASRRASGESTGTDPLLEELRKQYQHRVKELESRHRRASPVVRQGTWPQVGSVTSSRSSRSNSSTSSKGRRSDSSKE